MRDLVPHAPRRRLHIGGEMTRRAAVIGGACLGAGLLGRQGIIRLTGRSAPAPLAGRTVRSSVFIARDQAYAGDLVQTIRDGLLATGVDPVRLGGRTVLLKPNLVEPIRSAPHITTQPAVVVAAADVFRRWGARVVVAEGPGHVRDTEEALFESGFEKALREADLTFVDLNHDDVARVPNAGRRSRLASIHLPLVVLKADLIVSMPKLKTHHWIGMTASMKNLYGVYPGLIYGWPKNVLHHAGIPETVFDINATLPRTIAIVDAIECMEGDGPIMGRPKPLGVLLVGSCTAAVDATCARIMGLDPNRIDYLRLAEGRLGPIHDNRIEQRGEPWRQVASPFEILDVPHLRVLRGMGRILG